MEWLGHSRTAFHHSANPLPLHLKDGSTIPLSDLIKSTTPPCRLNPLLFNGHLQTCFTAFQKSAPHLVYKRKTFVAEDARFAGEFAVDFVVRSPTPEQLRTRDEGLPARTTHAQPDDEQGLGGDSARPLLIALHGLSGGSYEAYLRYVLAPLVAEGQGDGTGGGWDACVVTSRGCAGSRITSGVLFNARATWDVRQVVHWARRKWPDRKLFAVGFSLGANILTNYLGEEGERCEIVAAAIVSSPWKLEPSSIALQSSWIGLEVYSKTMGGNMKRLFFEHQDQIMKNGNIDIDQVKKVTYLHEFDRAIQCPTWGYPTEGAYYRDASSVDSIFDIHVPSLVINAEDDPIAPKSAVPYEEVHQTPYVVVCSTTQGGHLAWYEVGGGRWHARAVGNFFERMLRDVDFAATKTQKAKPEPEVASKSSYASPFIFEPMRRKCRLAEINTENDPFAG